LRSWLGAKSTETVPKSSETSGTVTTDAGAGSSSPSLTTEHIDTVLAAYTDWCGSFRDFCEHVKRQLSIDWGRDTIAHVLESQGLRQPQRRGGRSPDELALRGAFQTFFPVAQWVVDGMCVPVTINNEVLKLNFELQCDAFSGAFVGISIRDDEDSVAVIESFRNGVETTGQLLSPSCSTTSPRTILQRSTLRWAQPFGCGPLCNAHRTRRMWKAPLASSRPRLQRSNSTSGRERVRLQTKCSPSSLRLGPVP